MLTSSPSSFDPKRTLGEEAIAPLEPFAACQHLFWGLPVRGI
jgi:hypothetical protein